MNKIPGFAPTAPLTSEAALATLSDDLLPAVFARGLSLGPDRTAILFGAETISYGELDARSDALARALRARGVGRGSFVGLYMARSSALHVALLGILKAGAAYIPFDAEAPAERIAECLADCGSTLLVADADGVAKTSRIGVAVAEASALLAEDKGGAKPDPMADGVSGEDIAYVIYTSGSTGKPKGVMTTHRNICHFLHSANTVYGVGAEDVVFQGCSVAFDLSLEEIFLPYMTGAALWVASPADLADTEQLPKRLSQAGVSVIDTVPTLLAMMGEDIPSLRIIILGGESLPPALAERWCRAGRRLFNSYGPTEATVVATVDEVRPGEPVTIGRPIPGYSCYVVDEAMRLAAPGQEGELLIGGPGIAKGYLNRPELTAEKFIANPFSHDGSDPVLYRSGDAVAWDEQGRLVFRGRIDDQIKIRGFRVELGEIEARLARLPGIVQAAVAVRPDTGTDQLVAFVVPAAGAAISRQDLRQALRGQLPTYMIPSHFEAVAELPRLISGKVDRKALKVLPLGAIETEEQEEPANPIEAILLGAARKVFPGIAIPFDADIFLDLGGHSLIAAKFVSAAREHAEAAGITLQDVYAARTLRAMAERLIARQGERTGKVLDLSFAPPPLMRRFLCGLAQAAVLPIVLALITAPWLGVFIAYQLFSGEEHNFWNETAALLVTYAIINFGSIIISIIGKWLVIGRTKPGRYPLWGVYYFRWWLSQRFTSLVHLKWFQATPIMRLFLRLLGARIGRDAIIGDIEAGAIDLISIGDNAAIGGKTMIGNAQVIGGELIIGTVEIGAEAYTGTSCVISHDTVIEAGAELADLTSVPNGTRIGAWESWSGSPARKIGMVDRESLPAHAQASVMRRMALNLIYGLMLLLLPPITLMPIIPAFYLFDNLSDVLTPFLGVDYLTVLPLLAWPTAMALIAVTVLMIAAVRWVVLPRVRAGNYSIHSLFYLRKWIVALSTELTLETLSSLYATVYMRNWYRLMGAKIGKDAEISTNLAGRYDLVEIGEKCFIADEVVLGDEDIRNGWMVLKPVKTGPRVFVGNDAVVPPGTSLPEGTLIGIKSRPPLGQEVAPGDIWFGSPPIKLPVRQRFDDVDKNWTFEPSNWRRVGRAVFEAFSVSLPTMLFITFGTLAVEFLAPSINARDFARILPLFALCSVGVSSALVAAAILVKWLMMGAYRPTVKPMWSWWALRTEAVAVMYWGMAGKVMLDHLRGTPFLPWVLRLFGSKFGQGVFMDTTDITEFDCIDVGDFCAINSVAALQTHLYEDRVMKVGRVTLGRGVSVGTGSTVLYDTHIGDYADIGDLTIIMKGESIPASSRWRGAPAEGAV